MADMTPRQLLEEDLPRRFGAKAAALRRLDGVIVFEIRGAQGGTWTLDATSPSPSIAAGAGSAAPRMVVAARDADFVAVATGRLSAVQAVMSGRIRFKPFDMSLALALGELLA